MISKLIIESGATKSDWRLVCDNIQTARWLLPGMNVSSMTREKVHEILKDGLSELKKHDIEESISIHLYTAGVVTDEIRQDIREYISSFIETNEIEIENDVTASVRAVCGKGKGIVGILGTGANCCFCDGENIEFKVRSGGFIIGDEGGAARLGKVFLTDYIKDEIPSEIALDFAEKFEGDYDSIVRNIYKNPSPSAYLGSLAPFILSHYENPQIKKMVDDNFRLFIERSVLKYNTLEYPLGIVGGFGFACRKILEEILAEYNIKLSVMIPDPIENLVKYHTIS